MNSARAGRLTLRWVFPRIVRLLLTFLAVSLVGFYGAAQAARQAGSTWAYGHLPVFLNPAPQDVRSRALRAMRVAAEPDTAAALTARSELQRLGGAALPHVLPLLDSLEPAARGRVALALGPVALRMRVASPDEVASADKALLFFGRFWQDRSIEFRPSTVRRAVERLSERSLTLRRDDVIHADTYALEALIAALGRVRTQADVARVSRLQPVLLHVTNRGSPLSSSPTQEEVVRAVEGWQRLWLEEGADYTVLEGPRRVASFVAETQFGKWLAQARLWQLGRTAEGARVYPLVAAALPVSALHVLLLLAAVVAVAAGSALGAGTEGLAERASARARTAAASLVASYPVVLSLALLLELKSEEKGVLELCAEGLRRGDVGLVMGSLLGVTLLSELLVALPARLAATPGDRLEEDA
jgi:peptide/nickel transport system permease protein